MSKEKRTQALDRTPNAPHSVLHEQRDHDHHKEDLDVPLLRLHPAPIQSARSVPCREEALPLAGVQRGQRRKPRTQGEGTS
jgi:hypothetical protein